MDESSLNKNEQKRLQRILDNEKLNIVKSLTILIDDTKLFASKRPRATARGKIVRVYDPGSDDKKMVKEFIKEYILDLNFRNKISGIIDVEFTFKFPMPKYIKENRLKLYLAENQILLPSIKPDLDNLEKFYLDCMNGIVYHDDKQVTSLKSKKVYTQNENGIVEIILNYKENEFKMIR